MSFTYGSVTSGIEAASVAYEPLGWQPAWFSEIEPFPCKLLKYRYPLVPNLGDMMLLLKNKIFNESVINLLVGGTPCQSFSLAGLRAGLASANGNLALQFCRILRAKQPRWFVWENVPGVFSSFSNEEGSVDLQGEGRGNGRTITETADLATILAAFQECGYSCAWRVLDSQYFGVPQRRRRVFVVGHLGDDWRPSAAVLFEPESLRRDPAPLQKKEPEVAGTITARAGRSRGTGIDPGQIVAPLNAGYGDKQGQTNQDIKQGLPHLVPCCWDGGQLSQTLDAVLYKGQTMPEKNRFPAVLTPPIAFDYKTVGQPNNRTSINDKTPTLNTNGGMSTVTGQDEELIILNDQGGDRIAVEKGGKSPTLRSESHQHEPIVSGGRVIRRLTPLECERLQGFPDYYTAIPGATDAPRYKSLGNSMTTQVMHWIGRRIKLVEEILTPKP